MKPKATPLCGVVVYIRASGFSKYDRFSFPTPTDTATPTPTRILIPAGAIFLPGGQAPKAHDVAAIDEGAQAECDAHPGQCTRDAPKLQNPMPPGTLVKNRFELEWEDVLSPEDRNNGLWYKVVLCKEVNGVCQALNWRDLGFDKGRGKGKCTIGVDTGWQNPGLGKIWWSVRIRTRGDGTLVSRPGTSSSFIIVPRENQDNQLVAPSSGY